MRSAILDLISLSEAEKERRGLRHTPQEIFRQPQTWRSTYQRLLKNQGALEEFFRAVGAAHRAEDRPVILLAGAGTSDYVGKAVAALLRRRLGVETAAVPSTELLTNAEDYIRPGKRYWVISFSRSGNSSEGVAVIEQFLDRYGDQVRHLVITCHAKGKMGQLPGVLAAVLDESVNDRGLAMTSSFTNMVIAGQFLAHYADPAPFGKIVEQMAVMGSNLLPIASDLAQNLAKKGFRRICFLGSGVLHPVAEESALKVLELNAGRIPTLSQSHLGLRHGPLSFVDHETLVVSYLSGEGPRAAYDLDLLREILHKKLGAEMAIVAPRASKEISGLTRHVLTLHAPPAFPDVYLPAVDIILGQLLGLFTSIENEITPDSPSTGAISRVVSHVTIHPATEFDAMAPAHLR